MNDSSLAVKDKYEEEVGSWAVQVGLGVARCKVCLCTILFNKGRGALLKHSESEKHRRNRTAKPIGDSTELSEGRVKNEVGNFSFQNKSSVEKTCVVSFVCFKLQD